MSDTWNSDIWNSDIWPSNIWENEIGGFNEKYFFRGDCRTILDQGTLFNDATEMAQAIENSKPLTYKQFMSMIFLRDIPQTNFKKALVKYYPDKFKFGIGKGIEDFIFAYDTIEDIHYFFTL